MLNKVSSALCLIAAAILATKGGTLEEENPFFPLNLVKMYL